MLQNNWDIFLFNPLIILLLFIFYILILIKNIEVKNINQKLFFIQTFLYWFALSLIINNNFEFHNLLLKLLVNNKETFTMIILTSISFYSFLWIISYIFLWNKFFNYIKSNFFQYTIFGITIFGIFILIFYKSLPVLIISTIFISLGITSKFSYFLSYNYIYSSNFSLFKTISLISPLMIFAFIFGNELNNIIIIGFNLNNNLKIFFIEIISISSITIATFIYKLFPYKEYIPIWFTIEQKKIFEPFKLKIILIIFFMIILIFILKQISQSNIFLLLLGQYTWEKYHNNLKVIQFIRLNKQLFLIPQFFGAYLSCNLFYNKIGVKYSFVLGLLLWFIFFSIISFNHSPEAYLILQFINGLSFSICFNILFAMICEWKYRSPIKKTIISQFQLLLFGTEFIIKFIDNIFVYKKIGLFKKYIYNNYYIFCDNFAIKIDNVTTIISTICAIIILIILLIFYYTSDLILAEYRNHLRLLMPKINFLLRKKNNNIKMNFIYKKINKTKK